MTWYLERLRAWVRWSDDGSDRLEVVDTDIDIATRYESSPYAVGRALGVAFCFRFPAPAAIG